MPVEESCEDLGRSLWKPVDEEMSEPTLAQGAPLCCRTYPYINRVFGTIFNMDKMIGGSFDKGLADLKALAET